MSENPPKNDRTPRRRIFNPLRLADEEVEQSFIARRALFDSILNDVAAEHAGRSPQHHLIVGQRGMGKTLLLCRIAAELRKAQYRTRFLPLTFPEEQYVEVDRLSRFWLNCLDATADSLEAQGEHETARELDAEVARLDRGGKSEDVLAEETKARFQSAIDRLGRRPVLLVDNLHLLLKRLRKHDYALRGFFTRRGAAVLVGTATVVPEAMQDYGAAFYDSFKTHVLYRLSLDEMREVILELARQAGRPDVARRLEAEIPRLRVLRELTGGNPRTTVLLFELFARGFSEDPYEDLESLLDQVTPLYQSRLDQLAEQGQMIFSALARNWSPATAAELADLTGFPRGSISPQLGRLEEIGLVEKTAIFPGKKAGYQIAERFFNVWYLMRFGSRRQRKELVSLTRFLEAFYTPAELAARARCVLGKSELRSGEAKEAYERALEISPRDDWPRHDLVFLLRDLLQEPDAARRVLLELKEPDRWKDTQALHEALFAAYDSNWGVACDSLRKALARTDKALPVETRDDWYRSSAVIVHLGFGEKFVELLREEGADVRLMPWFEAVRAHVVGDERHLRNIPAEAQDAARHIYAAIDRWRKQLPNETQESAEH